MVKIYYKVSGVFQHNGDWSPRPNLSDLQAHYIINKAAYCPGYSFTLHGNAITITKITDKQKPAINFTCQ